MLPQDAHLLLQRYLGGECSPAEKELVEGWFAELGEEYSGEPVLEDAAAAHDRILMKIRAGLEELGQPVPAPVRHIGWWRYGVAAAVLIVAIAGWLLWQQHAEKRDNVPPPVAIEAAPGGNHAVLTLGDGRQVVLDSAANGLLAMQGNNRVIKQNGQLDYQAGTTTKDKEVLYNTLTTPRGGQHRLTLPDGTKVWLDAASSITYPTAFAGKTRRVTVTGQAYFEVIHDAKQPFEVGVDGLTVRDIGTSFNINAYSDEPAIKVTLAGGAAEVGAAGHSITLKKPGQQAEWRDSQLQAARDADLESVLAWKNGLFYLTSADIATVMREISRWYDVDIVFEKGVPAGHITGELPRSTMLSNILQVLQTSGVHFEVEDRTIRVMP
ncbi:MAG: FecR domain-containing protein [Bacteroidetes bacterium]|nr:FecR domain-containing protein [Bacteroidota bacterium]